MIPNARRSFAPPTQHHEEFAEFSQFLNPGQESPAPGLHYVIAPSDERRAIPAEVFELLTYAVTALSEGKGVTVTPTHTQLTTQQAADHLGISRPTVVKLLEQGHIPFTKVGRHRRVTLEDLVEYEQRVHQARRGALSKLTKDAASAGTYFEQPETSKTR